MDIFPIAPVPNQEPSPQNIGSSAGNDDSEFDTVLTKTISAQQNNQDSTSNPKLDTAPGEQQNTAENGDAELTGNQQSPPATEGISPEFSVTQLTDPAHTTTYYSAVITTATLKASLEAPQGSQQNHVDSAAQNPPPPISKGVESAGFLLNPFNQPVIQEVKTSEVFNPQFLSVVIKGNPQLQPPINSVDSEQSSLLLAQLQKLIGQNNDKVNMTASFSSPTNRELPGYMGSPVILQAADSSADITATVTGNTLPGLLAVTTESVSQAKTESQPATLRQDVLGQYLNAKISNPEKQTESHDKNETSQQNTTSQQQQMLTATQGNTTPAPSDQIPPAQGFSAQLQDITLQQTSEAARSSQAQSSSNMPHVYEDDVINQIIKRFSVHSRLQTSRLSLQLHPAELGELKIDIIVKRDSLKANIYAQTQQAQEIIEKHLPRLRAILQEQGMSVDDIIVTLESDSVDDFTKQQSQLFQEQLADFKHDDRRPETSSLEQSFEETVFNMNEEPSGVNLTV